MKRFYDWCVKYGVAGGLFPTLFDFPELWRLNATRFPGFNIVFCWFYVLSLMFFIPFTILCLMEGFLKWKFGDSTVETSYEDG